jgi:ribosomal protein S18 acetylase RimI-like enzyme
MTDTVRRASVSDVDQVAPLFDAYRQFYKLPPDLARARGFLRERLSQNQSIVLLANAPDGAAVGFVQLYPTYSSLRTAPIYVLYDLFVDPAARGRGVGRLLMEAAARLARETGFAGMTLSTAITNKRAQGLYESLGWKRDEEFYTYELDLRG